MYAVPNLLMIPILMNNTKLAKDKFGVMFRNAFRAFTFLHPHCSTELIREILGMDAERLEKFAIELSIRNRYTKN